MPHSTKLTVLALTALAALCFFGARYAASSRARALPAPAPPTAALAAPSAPALELRVPHLKASIVLDGDMDDVGWTGPVARTGGFTTPNGMTAKPYSEARLVWGDGHLYLALYAADEDVRAAKRAPDDPVWQDDSFHLVFRDDRGGVERALDLSALGVVSDARRVGAGALDYAWQSGVHVSREIDGTLNDANDDDEEWALEVAMPLESLGLRGERGERIGFAVRRCDTPHRSARVCASWGEGDARGTLVLD